jgi:hypothetical protein
MYGGRDGRIDGGETEIDGSIYGRINRGIYGGIGRRIEGGYILAKDRTNRIHNSSGFPYHSNFSESELSAITKARKQNSHCHKQRV